MKILTLSQRFIRLALILGHLIFIYLFLFILPHPIQAGGEVTDCSAYSGNANRLEAMLAGGGDVTFNCNGVNDPATIIITSTVAISQDTAIRGDGIITLSGEGGTDRIFRIDSGTPVTFTLAGLKVISTTNTTSFLGSAIYIDNPSFETRLNVISSTFSGNQASTGGAIFADGNFTGLTVLIENSTFDNNEAVGGVGTDGGGALYLFEVASATVRNSTFYSNTSVAGGGAIGIDQSGTLSLINTTIVSNTAAQGGGVGRSTGSLNLFTLNFENNIIAGNSNGECSVTDVFTSTIGANFATDDTCGAFTTVTVDDLQLGPFSDNGGGTLTIPLLPGSDAIDAVPDGECNVSTDQRGVTRPQNGLCDAGAFELAIGVNLELVKTVAPSAVVTPGDTITYTITFSNTGADTAAGVVLTDIIPTSVTVLSVVSSGVTITDTGTVPGFVWDIGDLGSGASGIITVTAEVSATLERGESFTNTAIITTTSAMTGGTIIAEAPVTIGPLVLSDLTITKTVTPVGPVSPGDPITYTLVFSNAETDLATEVRITDVIPAEVSITGVTSSGVLITDTGAISDFVWAVQDLAQGEGGIITLTGNISSGLTSDVTFTNTAIITTATAEGNPDNNQAEVSLVVNTPLLTVTKSVTPDTDVTVQGEVTYTITLSNSGTGTAQSVSLTDTLPLSVTFSRWLTEPVGSSVISDEITWNGVITGGEAVVFGFVVTHTGSYSDVVTNTARYSHTTSLGQSNVATFTVLGPPAVTLFPTSLDFGDQGVGTTSPTQTVTLTNTGISPLNIISITITGNFSQTHNCPASLSSNSSCTIEVNFTPPVTGVQTGTLSVNSNASTSPDIVSLLGTGVTAGLTLRKSVTPQTNVAFRGEVTYTLTLSNTGLGDALGVLLTDTLSLSTTFARWVNQPPGAIDSANLVTWSGTVTAGEAVNFSFVVSHTGAYSDVITNTALFSHTTASGASNIVTFTVLGPPAALLNPTSLNFGSQTVGTTSATRAVTLTNTGASPLVITTTTISGDYSQTDNCPASLASGANCVFQIQFSPTVTGTRPGTLTLTTNAPNSPHLVTLTGIGAGPSLSLTKSVTPQTNVAFGGEVTYTLVLSNSGAGSAVGAVLTDTLPVSTTFARWVTQPAGAAENSSQITWSGTVSSNQAITFRFVATHTGSFGDVVTNTALFSHTSNSGISNVATFTVAGPPAVTLSPSSLDFGNQFVGTTSATQTVTLTNSGGAPLDITSITISGEFSQTNNCPAFLNSNSSCTIGITFSPTAAGPITGALTVDSNAASSPDIVTLAGVGVFPPALAISKSVTPQSDVAYQGEVTYTVVISNSGLGNADNVLFTDTLPAETDFNRWIEQPAGANESNDQITWSGTVTSGGAVTFTFAASHTGNFSDTVVNIAQYSHTTGSGLAQATFTVISDTTPPVFPSPALITPTAGVVLSDPLPVFDWEDAVDSQSGVVSYTLVVTGLNGGTSFTVVTTDSTFIPGASLANGDYTWTVQAFDAFGNASGFVPPESFSINFIGLTYLPLVLNTLAPPELPDMVIDELSVVDCVGSTCTVRVVARNQSATPVTFGNNFYVNVYQDGDFDIPIIGFGVQASWFGAGQSRVLEQSYTFSSGPHSLRAWADAFDTVVEVDEDNNTLDRDITIAGLRGQEVPANPVLPAGPQPTPTNTP